jgi:hypothetical protein
MDMYGNERIMVYPYDMEFSPLMRHKAMLGDIETSVYLFFDVESTFKITITQADITTGRFNTFNNIEDIIEKSSTISHIDLWGRKMYL